MYEENEKGTYAETDVTVSGGAANNASPAAQETGYNAGAGNTEEPCPPRQDSATLSTTTAAVTPERILQAGDAPAAPSPAAQKKKRHCGRKVLLALACIACALLGGLAGAYLAADGLTERVTAEVNENLSQLMEEAGGTVLYRSVETAASETGSGADTMVANVAELAADSVVEIATEIAVNNNDPFSWFFGNSGQTLQQGAGSGVILSEDGYILTCYHVVEDATSIAVALRSGETYQATMVGGDAEKDLAVIKIEAENLKPAVLGDSAELVVGSPVVAIGNPLGQLGGTVTSGYISALSREVTIGEYSYSLLQTDAAINGGNSGGGLFNANGELIGLVNAKAEDIGVEGLGFAIPIDDIKQDIEDIINYGGVVRVELGVTLLNATSERTALAYGLDEPGVYIAAVERDSNADRGGLQAGDRVVSADGETIEDAERLIEIIGSKAPGDTISIVVMRDGTERAVDIVLYANVTESGTVQPTTNR